MEDNTIRIQLYIGRFGKNRGSTSDTFYLSHNEIKTISDIKKKIVRENPIWILTHTTTNHDHYETTTNREIYLTVEDFNIDWVEKSQYDNDIIKKYLDDDVLLEKYTNGHFLMHSYFNEEAMVIDHKQKMLLLNK